MKRTLLGGIAGALLGVLLGWIKETLWPSPWHEFGAELLIIPAVLNGAFFGVIGAATGSLAAGICSAAGIVTLEAALMEGAFGAEPMIRAMAAVPAGLFGAFIGQRESRRPPRKRHRIVGFLLGATLLAILLGLAWSLAPYGLEGRCEYAVEDLSFFPDGHTLAIGVTREVNRIAPVPDLESVTHGIVVLDLRTRTLQWAISGLEGKMAVMALSPDGTHAATTGGAETLTLWEVGTWRERHALDVLEGSGDEAIWSLAFSPDGKTLVSGGLDKFVKWWDVASGNLLATLPHSDGVTSVAFSPDGRTLAAGSRNGSITFWDLGTRTEKLTLAGPTDGVVCIAVSPDGQKLVSGGWDHKLRVWDTTSGKELRTLVGHTDTVRTVTFSPDGSTFVSGADDDTARLWDVETGSPKGVITTRAGAIAYSPDGRIFATGKSAPMFFNIGENEVRLWDAETLRPDAVLSAPSNMANRPWKFFIAGLVLWFLGWAKLRPTDARERSSSFERLDQVPR